MTAPHPDAPPAASAEAEATLRGASAEARRLIDALEWQTKDEKAALLAYVAGLEAEVARLQSTLAMPTHMLVPRVLPSGALKAAERHCDWTQVQHAWGQS